MKCYIISYDLDGEDPNYEELKEKIKSYDQCCSITQSTWGICTNMGLNDVFQQLSEILNEDDKLFVSESVDNAIWTDNITTEENDPFEIFGSNRKDI